MSGLLSGYMRLSPGVKLQTQQGNSTGGVIIIFLLAKNMFGGNVVSVGLMLFPLQIIHNIHNKQISKMFTASIFQLIVSLYLFIHVDI